MSGRKQSVKFSYYKWNRLNSYNGAFNMVIGARGLGKTYGCKRDAIKAYLRDGNSVTEVATAVGYSTPANFAAAFRRWIGCTPSEWLRAQRN